VTTVINLFGGPNSGKSTCASGLFYFLKLKHFHCEIVREYVKSWAWEGRKPNKYDQPYIFGKQLKYESSLYDKVDFIITDSPLMLSAFYEDLYEQQSIIKDAAFRFMNKAQENNVVYRNFWLSTVDNIDTRGRFGEEKSFVEQGHKMRDWLEKNHIKFEEVPINIDGEDRVKFLLNKITQA